MLEDNCKLFAQNIKKYREIKGFIKILLNTITQHN